MIRLSSPCVSSVALFSASAGLFRFSGLLTLIVGCESEGGREGGREGMITLSKHRFIAEHERRLLLYSIDPGHFGTSHFVVLPSKIWQYNPL